MLYPTVKENAGKLNVPSWKNGNENDTTTTQGKRARSTAGQALLGYEHVASLATSNVNSHEAWWL